MMLLIDYDVATSSLISSNEYTSRDALRAKLSELESDYRRAGIKSHKVFMACGTDIAHIKRGFSELNTIDELTYRLETELAKQ
jgi:hypothetical protein